MQSNEAPETAPMLKNAVLRRIAGGVKPAIRRERMSINASKVRQRAIR